MRGMDTLSVFGKKFAASIEKFFICGESKVIKRKFTVIVFKAFCIF